MKSYWDHTEKERSELDHDQVEALLKIELMEQGVVEPEEPELLDVNEPELKTTKLYEVVSGEKYDEQRSDIAFETLEQEQAFIDLHPYKCGTDWKYGNGDIKFANKMQNCGIREITIPTEGEIELHGERLKAVVHAKTATSNSWRNTGRRWKQLAKQRKKCGTTGFNASPMPASIKRLSTP